MTSANSNSIVEGKTWKLTSICQHKNHNCSRATIHNWSSLTVHSSNSRLPAGNWTWSRLIEASSAFITIRVIGNHWTTHFQNKKHLFILLPFTIYKLLYYYISQNCDLRRLESSNSFVYDGDILGTVALPKRPVFDAISLCFLARRFFHETLT